MRLGEIVELFKAITNAYPMFRLTDEIEARERAIFWHAHLKDTPFELATSNLNSHIATEKYPPTIADLRRQPETDEITKYHEHLRSSAQEHFRNMDEAKLNAVPPPEHLREWVKKLGT